MSLLSPELILTGQIHDHKARKKSFGVAAKVLGEMMVSNKA